MFFTVWQREGLNQEPKIVLNDTKQIIPDKNLFGQSNFVSHTADSTSQLKKVGRYGRKHEDMMKNHLDSNNRKSNADSKSNMDNDIEIRYTADSYDHGDQLECKSNVNELQLTNKETMNDALEIEYINEATQL